MSARLWRLLLRAYPMWFREAYGREMTQLFDDRRRDAAGHSLRFWWEIVCDVARSAPALRAEALAARCSTTHDTEGTMRAIAMVTVLAGAYGVVGALSELYAGGVRNGDPVSMASGGIAAFAGVLVATAGVMLLRRTPNAVAWARRAAVACLVSYAVIAVAAPRLSVFMMLLGVGVPVALLVTLYRTGGRGTPTMA